MNSKLIIEGLELSRLIKISEVDDALDNLQNYMAYAVSKDGIKTTLFFNSAKQATEWAIDFLTNSNIESIGVYGIELWARIEREEKTDNE